MPVRRVPAAVPAIGDWCRARSVRRPILIGGRFLATPPKGLGVVHALEAEGLAVWPFDRADAPTLATVADAVAGYHFEGCDSVIAIGGAVALEVAKATALMVAQRSPFRSLAAEPGAEGEPVETAAIPPLLAVPSTPSAALSLGCATWIADDAGVARPLRHPALRPGEAVLADDLTGAVADEAQAASREAAALIAFDAGASDAGVAALLDPERAMPAALELSGLVEGAVGPRRRLALTAALLGDADFAPVMASLSGSVSPPAGQRGLAGADPGGKPLLDLRIVRAVRDACSVGDAAVLDRLLEELGIDWREATRRRGRRGRVE